MCGFPLHSERTLAGGARHCSLAPGAPRMLARVQQQGLQMVGKADQTMDPVFDELNREFAKFRAALDKTEKAVRFHQGAATAHW